MRKLFSFLALSFTLLVTIFVVLTKAFSFSPEYELLTLSRGWIVTYHNEKYLNTNLENLSKELGSSFSRGDVLQLTLNYPLKDAGCPFPYLMFKTQHCGYEVFLDNDLIASKDVDAISNNDYVGVGYNLIPLGYNYDNKRLTIKLYMTENDSRPDLISPIVGNYDDLIRYHLHSVLFPMFTGTFLMLFGQVFLIISLIFYIRSSGILVQVLSSFISMLIGIWILTVFNISDLFITKSVSTIVQHMSLYLLLPSIYFLVIILHRHLDNIFIKIMGYASLFFVLLFISMHFLNIIHIHHFLYPFHVLAIIGTIILFVYDYIDFKSKLKNDSTKIIMIGLTVQCTSFIMYIFLALSKIYVDYRQNLMNSIVISTGSLFFVITQLLNYFIFMTRSFAQHREYASLSQIAFVDSLTNLKNRVSCDRKYNELDSSDDDFCIISLDLNGLKEVNDNAGHPAGDRLLSSFAGALAQVFVNAGTCYRIGGDEFIVITQGLTATEIDSLLATLTNKLLDLDKKDPEINHSVSYGYAFRSETEDKDSHATSMLADKRMYDFKNKYYSYMMTR